MGPGCLWGPSTSWTTVRPRHALDHRPAQARLGPPSGPGLVPLGLGASYGLVPPAQAPEQAWCPLCGPGTNRDGHIYTAIYIFIHQEAELWESETAIGFSRLTFDPATGRRRR
jgi:hypothetical protein